MTAFGTSDSDSEIMSRYFSGADTPIINVVGQVGNLWDDQIVINLGNLGGEKALRHKPVVLITSLLVCTGCTCWLLEIVDTEWCVVLLKIFLKEVPTLVYQPF